MQRYSLQRAQPQDLHTLVAIDDDASSLYQQARLAVMLEYDHPFVLAESKRWADAIDQGLVFMAIDQNNEPAGFAALGWVDGKPYLDQLSVHTKHMRQGVGALLLKRALQWSADNPLWLTTYGSLPWNKPYYERHGFIEVKETECGPELREVLQKQRLALP